MNQEQAAEVATECVKAIIDDLTTRQGGRQSWERTREDIKIEIQEDGRDIIFSKLARFAE